MCRSRKDARVIRAGAILFGVNLLLVLSFVARIQGHTCSTPPPHCDRKYKLRDADQILVMFDQHGKLLLKSDVIDRLFIISTI